MQSKDAVMKKKKKVKETTVIDLSADGTDGKVPFDADEFHTNHHDYPELNSGELNYRLTIPPLYPHPHREINPESSLWERAQERIN